MPEGQSRQWRDRVICGNDDKLERHLGYRPGGYHPVRLDDCLHDGRYRVVDKLGYGGFSTVWLCEDTHHDTTPRYVAVKILVARESKTECRELLVTKHLQDIGIHEMGGGDHICLPLGHFQLTGPNGTHLCLVYPVLGPDLGSAMNVFDEYREPGECERDVRQLCQQVVAGVATLHNNGICHGDLRPFNILVQMRTLDGLDREQVYDLLGEPEKAELIIRDAKGQRRTVSGVPDYLVYPIEFDCLPLPHVIKHAVITDFGQAFDTATEPMRNSGIPRPYCAPEVVLDKAAGIASDLWSLGCLLFEARLGDKIIWPCDVMGPNDQEYILTVVLILGRLPEPWWGAWKNRGDFFEAADDGEVHGRLVSTGRVSKQRPKGVEDPASIKDKILASRRRRIRDSISKKYQEVSEAETDQLADLIGKFLRYVPEERISAREALDHKWFSM